MLLDWRHRRPRRDLRGPALGLGDPMVDNRGHESQGSESGERERTRRRVWREANRERIAAQARDYRERNREALAASARAYRERNKDAIREKAKLYRERDKEKRREYVRGYNDTHRDRKNEVARESARRVADRKRAEAARVEAEAKRAEKRRAYAREWYAANREQYLAYQREQRTKQKDADPDAYRAVRRAANKRWRDSHKDEQNARQRDRYRVEPRPDLDARARYYAAHAEALTARKRERYWANHEEELAKQRAWREREKRRRAAGLPTRALHRVPAAERDANQAGADEFFARTYTPAEVAALMVTPARLIARWERDSERARVASYYVLGPEISSVAMKSAARRARAERARAERDAAAKAVRDAENARLDAIARAINDGLRHPRAPRSFHDRDDTAPVHGPVALDRTGIHL